MGTMLCPAERTLGEGLSRGQGRSLSQAPAQKRSQCLHRGAGAEVSPHPACWGLWPGMDLGMTPARRILRVRETQSVDQNQRSRVRSRSRAYLGGGQQAQQHGLGGRSSVGAQYVHSVCCPGPQHARCGCGAQPLVLEGLSGGAQQELGIELGGLCGESALGPGCRAHPEPPAALSV